MGDTLVMYQADRFHYWYLIPPEEKEALKIFRKVSEWVLDVSNLDVYETRTLKAVQVASWALYQHKNMEFAGILKRKFPALPEVIQNYKGIIPDCRKYFVNQASITGVNISEVIMFGWVEE